MGDSGNFSGSKILAIILIVLIVMGLLFFAVIDGMVETIKNFFKGLVTNVIEEAEVLWDKIKGLLGISVVKNGMYIYPIDKGAVSALKQELEAKSISTDNSGITEVMLRKILLTQAVTSSTQDTLCIAEIDEQEILKGTEYEGKSLKEYFNSLPNKKSKDEWPIKDYDYDLYYITDYFFYFQDKDNMLGKGNDKYYLGIEGTININASDGSTLKYVSEGQFKEIKSNYENKKSDQNRYDLLHHYTIGSDGQMKIYKIIENTNTYSYIFTNTGSGEKIEKLDVKDGNSTYNIVEVPLDIQSNVNTEQYAVTIELLINFLNISASPEYLDEFIDYAIENTKFTITGYQLNNEEISYEKETANIQDDFIFELYDMVEAGIDHNYDNMKTYKSLIHDRMYNGSPFATSVVELSDFENIDYYEVPKAAEVIEKVEVHYIGNEKQINMSIDPDGTQGLFNLDFKGYVKHYGGSTEEEVRKFLKEQYSYTKDNGVNEEELNILVKYICTGEDPRSKVNPIKKYLKTAYDPGTGFSLGDITVEKISTNKRFETTWTFCVSSISTWFGNITYGEPSSTKNYSIDVTDCNEAEYNSFDSSKLTEYEDIEGTENTKIIINNQRANEAGIVAGGNTVIVNNDDIFAETLSEDVGNDKDENFAKWTLRGLGLISMKDKGNYNATTGALSGADYLYTKYTTINNKKYHKVTKFAMDSIDENTNLPQVDVKNVEKFLSLWKNETGEIGNKVYKTDGIKVKYKDIYQGNTVVGDMFESAPEMTFQLLESSDSTRGVVDIFKYIMYKYTGIDYGITDESQIAFIFNTNAYGGSDYVVNTAMSDDELVLEKQQLEEAIKKSYKGNTQKNLLSCLDDFMYIQENNKVNAVFATAVTIIESSGGTNWAAIDPSTYNWMSVSYWTGSTCTTTQKNGKYTWCGYDSFQHATKDFGAYIATSSHYFKAGKYTVTAIAPTYFNEEWGNSVISEMTKIYNSIGISGATGGIEGTTGNYTTFTVGNRTYINYKQIEPSYKSIPLACYPGSTLYGAGCGITSDAIIGSGFGSNMDPVAVNRLNSNVHPGILKTLTGREWVQNRSFSKQAVIDELKRGNPVIVRYEGDGGFARSSGHFVAILSISEDGSKMYVSNPASRNESKTGWLKTSHLNASGYCQYIKLK